MCQPGGLIISARNEDNISYFDYGAETKRTMLEIWHRDYLGISKDKIINFGQDV
jgi:hypothetical protein